MDWTKQTEEMVKAWTDTQKKMWDNWMGMLQQGPSAMPAAEVWTKTLETWEGAVKNTLETQQNWTEMWLENMTKSMGSSKEMTEWATQAQEMTKRWAEAQQQLWDSWFEMVRKMDPAKMMPGMEDSEEMFKMWQDSVQKLMNAQMEWTQMVTKMGQPDSKEKA